MEGDIPSTLLFIFLAIFQIYLFLFIGSISAIRNLMNAKAVRSMSDLLINFVMPIYGTMELARMATWENVEIMWIMILSVLSSIFLGYVLGQLTHWFFKLDVRYKRSYPLMMCLPTLGSLPLVMSKCLCLPGGMLVGDQKCDSILGFMMMNFLIFQMTLLIGGFILMPSDAVYANTLMEKLGYIWHIIIPKVFDKNYTVYYIFNRFMKDDKTAKSLFKIFESKYKLELSDWGEMKYKFSDKKEVELDFVPIIRPLQFETPACPENEDLQTKVNNDEKMKTENLAPEENKVINSEQVLIEKHDQPVKEDEVVIEMRVKSNKSLQTERTPSSEDDVDVMEAELTKAMNYVLADYNVEDEKENAPSNHHLRNDPLVRSLIQIQKQKSIILFENHIELYYQKLFGFVEKHLDEKKREEYEEYKISIFQSLYENPPKFPAVKFLELTRDNIPLIEEEWTKFETEIKKIKPDFALKTITIPISLNLIINKIHSPPIIGCFLGLLIGVSGMREILFSSNHYITNFVDAIQIVSKSNVTFQYTLFGISLFSVRKLNFFNFPMTKRYVILSCIIRFLLLPGIGLLYVFLWKNYYGGMVASSKVFRISLFIPFALPSAGTIVVIVNIIKFFSEETGFILASQNVTDLVTLTLLYLIYYVTLGCRECKDSICQVCFDSPKDISAFANYQSTTEPGNKTCPNHINKTLEFQCLDCDSPICDFCSRKDHKDHRMEYIVNFYEIKMKEINYNFQLMPFKTFEEYDDCLIIEHDQLQRIITQQSKLLQDKVGSKEVLLINAKEMKEEATLDYEIIEAFTSNYSRNTKLCPLKTI